MKKFILVGAITIASMVQAASFKWTTSGILDVEGSGTVSCSAVLTAYAAGTSTIIASYTQDITAGALEYTITDAKFVTGSKYDFIMVATTTYSEKKYIWTSTTKANKTAQAESTPTLAWGATTHTTGEGINANGWAGAVIPEPTSGMLMLLGLAGLGLKRKRLR